MKSAIHLVILNNNYRRSQFMAYLKDANCLLRNVLIKPLRPIEWQGMFLLMHWIGLVFSNKVFQVPLGKDKACGVMSMFIKKAIKNVLPLKGWILQKTKVHAIFSKDFVGHDILLERSILKLFYY